MDHRGTISSLPRGTNLARFVQALGNSKSFEDAAAHAEQRWRNSPAVHLTLRAYVPAMSVAGAGSALSGYGIDTELVELLNSATVIGKLKGKTRHVPLKVKVAIEDTGASSQWIGEGFATPAAALAFSDAEIEPFKLSTIVVFSKELMRFSTPSAEQAVRRSLINGVASYLDSQFLDPAVSLIVGIRPASITNGGGTVVSTGTTLALIEADLNSMLALLGSWEAPYWIGRPKTMAYLATKFGAVGMGPNIMGFPFIASANSPAQIVLVDAADIVLGDENQAEISLSEEASILLNDSPELSPMTSSLTSLWSRNLVAIKVLRWISYLLGHNTSAVYMTVSY